MTTFSNLRPFPALLLVLSVALGACKSDETSKTGGATTKSPSPTATQVIGGAGSEQVQKLPSPASAPDALKSGAPLVAGAVKPTDPGTFLFVEEGLTDFQQPAGCPPDRAAPSPSKLTVQPAQSSRQEWVRDRRGSDNEGLVINLVLEYRKDGVYLAYLKQEQHSTFLPQPFVTEFEPSPPVLVSPYNAKVGTTFQFSLISKDGKTKVDSTGVVEALEETVTIKDGSTHKATRVKRASHIEGESPLGHFRADETNTSWISPEARLNLIEDVQTSGSIGTCNFEARLKSTIQSTKPR